MAAAAAAELEVVPVPVALVAQEVVALAQRALA